MIAQINHTNQSHKSITHVTVKNENLKQCFQMLQSNSGAYGGPETG